MITEKPICPKFAESFINRTNGHRVLGRKLLPLSNWHSMLLRFYQSPVVLASRPAGILDLERAVRICRCKYPNRPTFRFTTLMSGVSWFLFRRSIVGQCQGFSDYVEDYLSPPTFWQEEGGAPRTMRGQMPPELATVSKLMEMGVSEKDAWDMPVGKAMWYSAAHIANNGTPLDFDEPLSKEMEDRLRKRMEKDRAKEKKQGAGSGSADGLTDRQRHGSRRRKR